MGRMCAPFAYERIDVPRLEVTRTNCSELTLEESVLVACAMMLLAVLRPAWEKAGYVCV